MRIGRWAAVFLVGSLFVAPIANAGLLGALAGGYLEHRIEQHQAADGQATLLDRHPIAGAVAGSVAGSLAEGAVVHEVNASLLLNLRKICHGNYFLVGML